MGKCYIINNDEVELVINITQVDKLFNNSLSLKNVFLTVATQEDIDNIFTVVEEYEAGGGGGEDWHSKNPLCFTAEQANSTIKITNSRLSSPEISYNGTDWEEYTEGTIITLSNIGDKVYFRSKLVSYSTGTAFTMTGKIASSGNPESLHELTKGELYTYCYSNMFSGCSSLTTAPELPATTLARYCYNGMFNSCKSLTTVPELPATTLVDYCYNGMFKDCTSLTEAPELPATTLASNCYSNMFYGCSNLTQAPELPATTLAQYCYNQMFYGCTSLTQAPELPATTLAQYCYQGMFNGCKSLTTAPELPATTMEVYCYNSMFQNCSNLNYIKTDIRRWNTRYADNWVSGVSATGTFVCHYGADNYMGNSTSGIPKGWTVEYYTNDSLRFTALKDTNIKLSYVHYSEEITSSKTVYYIKNGIATKYDINTYIDLSEGDEIGFVGTLGTNSQWYGFRFKSEYPSSQASLKLSGSLMSLSGNYTNDSGGGYLCQSLFENMPIVDASELKIDVDSPGSDCYRSMFSGCTSLTQAPELPATTLTSYCYTNMFKDCTSLTKAPELPATTLAQYCYQYMFNGCTSLTQAPELPATTLKDYCYQYMFNGCTSLTDTPELPTTTLASYCYSYMFNGCTSLTTAPELPATTLASYCYHYMFKDCTSLTTAPELPAATLAQSCYYYMFSGCTSLTTAPELPAATLANNCYYQMFSGCNNLNYIKVGATSWNTSYANNWVSGVSKTGTFVKPEATTISTSASGIPSGWTVETY